MIHAVYYSLRNVFFFADKTRFSVATSMLWSGSVVDFVFLRDDERFCQVKFALGNLAGANG